MIGPGYMLSIRTSTQSGNVVLLGPRDSAGKLGSRAVGFHLVWIKYIV